MSIKIEQIRIMINPSIPDSKPVELTSDLIYHPELNIGKKVVLEKMPYFTASIKYPIDKLQLLSKISYKKIVKFFFNKKYFESKLISIIKQTSQTDNQEIDKTEKENIYNYNVMVMLHFLFPTVFPGVNNLVSSFDAYITGTKDSSLPTFSVPISGMVSSKNNYSYLNLNGSKYTITKVIWLNDILNNPIYNELIDKYLSYKLWIKENEITTKTVVANGLKKKILKRLQLDPKNKDSLQITDAIIQAFDGNKTKPQGKLEEQKSQSSTQNYYYQNTDTISFIETIEKIVEKLKLLQADKIKNNTNEKGNIKDDFYIEKNDLTVKSSQEKKGGKAETETQTGENNTSSENSKKDDESSQISDSINYLMTIITDINELYTKLKGNSKNTLSGIPSNFPNLLNTLTNEIKNVSILNKIANVYMNSQSTNLNYEKDDPEVVKVLKERYTKFTDYIDSINKFLPPVKISSNHHLQEIIGDYTTNDKKPSLISQNQNKDVLLFEEIMEKTKEELMYSKNLSYFLNEEAFKYLKTGVNILLSSAIGTPTIEIQIAVDLIEGEYSDENIGKIKCKYRSLFLGQETELYFSNQNKYDYESHKIFLSKEQIEEDYKKNGEPPKEQPKKGGKYIKKTQKRKLKSKRITHKYR